MRTCKVCGQTKNIDNFYACGKNTQGVLQYALTCKCCVKKRSQSRYYSVSGKAVELFHSAKRKNKQDRDFSIDLDFIINRLEKGVCEVTGIPFSYERKECGKTNKYAPSLDRRDSNLGYTRNNTRLVIWWYNLMKNDETDENTLKFCQAVVENLHRNK
jgi:hypothetical protein